MTDDQSFDAPDPFDDELRRRFAGSAPTGSDPDVVLDAMRPQLARARTRRRASFASAIAGVAVIVVALAFVLGGGGGSSSVHTPPGDGRAGAHRAARAHDGGGRWVGDNPRHAAGRPPERPIHGGHRPERARRDAADRT